MPIPTTNLIEKMGPLVAPFERSNLKRNETKAPLEQDLIRKIEDIYDATEDEYPPNADICINKEMDLKDVTKRYLWIIDCQGLRILKERFINDDGNLMVNRHTNIYGGDKALQGGELWFGENKTVYINDKSGRYGDDWDIPTQWDGVMEYFKYVGYNPIDVRGE